MKTKPVKGELWQEKPNCVWFTDIIPVCDICGEESGRVVEIKINPEDKGVRACFHGCLIKTIQDCFRDHPAADRLIMRAIEFKKHTGGGPAGHVPDRPVPEGFLAMPRGASELGGG
jgi:hypothetical protein